ncbi:DMT family transporter [Reinekea marinisedimentorum]|uniref:EamA-like transporter family protein n=1 Tax=Reinekea marinisedimentorum TaxID=230495 RepID=A0A4R3I9L4_9GAMM|nr:DMT family transporter [Reinekea marinisedimentorum]TCS40995.1 EamA-like transporter family protein [Reinekea marinisedimentorum]
MHTTKLHKQNLIGSLWMIAAMGGFALEDSFVKVTTKTLPIGEVLVLFGLGGALIYAAILLLHRRPLYIPDVLSRPMLLRMGFEVTGRLFYVLAIALIPLSVTTVILQATPLVVVAGAVVVFGERVGWRRWVAIVVGLIGVMVILQPGAEGFSWLSLFAIVGMLGFAGRDLASRVAPATVGTYLLGFYGFLSIVVAGLIHSVWAATPPVLPNAEASLALLCGILFGVLAYSCLMKAMKTGEVSAVTPFRYVRLLFGMALGVLVFGEAISLNMLVGSALILTSGLFIMWRKGNTVTAR